MQTAVVRSCLPFIKSGQNHHARHIERGKKTRQTEEEVGRQHQGMDRPGVRQVPESSGERGKNGGNWLRNHLQSPNDDDDETSGTPPKIPPSGWLLTLRATDWFCIRLYMRSEGINLFTKFVILHTSSRGTYCETDIGRLFVSLASSCLERLDYFLTSDLSCCLVSSICVVRSVSN